MYKSSMQKPLKQPHCVYYVTKILLKRYRKITTVLKKTVFLSFVHVKVYPINPLPTEKSMLYNACYYIVVLAFLFNIN
jgi:hypothetical protein